jgi:DNA-directed RNA polymerase specialized sigma24 family protein
MLSSLASVRALTGGSVSPIAPVRIAAPDPLDWPALWARCWSRIRTWPVPPRWLPTDWWDEARAQGALAACEARRSFDPGRLVPLDAFLYRRVVERVWTHYRQEWTFGRRCRPAAALADRSATETDRPDPELVERLITTVGDRPEAERWFLRRLFWEGRTVDQLALEFGVSRQAVNKRKQKLLRQLRSELVLEGRSSGVRRSSSEIAFIANARPGIAS